MNATRKATTPRLQKGKSKGHSILKPVSSRISKKPPQERSLRRRIPKVQHGAENLGEKLGDSQKTGQDEPQNSNFASPATLPPGQADQSGNLNNQPNPPTRQVQPHRTRIALHPNSVQRVTRRRTRAPQSQLSTKMNAESVISSMVHKRRRQNLARGAWHPKQENMQSSPRGYKTKSGRVSKRPERLVFT